MTDGPWLGIATPALRFSGRPGVSAMPLPGLLVGEYPAPSDVRWLREEHRVDAVLCLQDEYDLAAKRIDPAVLAEAYRREGIGFHHLPVTDGDIPGLVSRFPAILGILDDLLGSGRRVYLHCNAGFNRAPTVAIAYLRTRASMNLAEAWHAVRNHRPCAPYRRALAALFPGEEIP